MRDWVCIVTVESSAAPAEAVRIRARRLHHDPYQRAIADKLVAAGLAVAGDGQQLVTYSFEEGSAHTTLSLLSGDPDTRDTLGWAVESLAARTSPARADNSLRGRLVVASAALVAAVLVGVVVIAPAVGKHSGEAGTRVAAAMRAEAVAVASAGGGRAVGVEHDPDDAMAWEVEVSTAAGHNEDVHLDRNFNVIDAE